MDSGERDLVWMNLQTAAAALDGELNARLERRAGMSSTQFQALWYLANAVDRAMTMSGIAARLSMSASGMTRLADRLVANGWAVRSTDPANRRVLLLGLTKEGSAAARSGYQIALQVRQELLDGRLDDAEIAALGGLLSKLLGHIEVADLNR